MGKRPAPPDSRVKKPTRWLLSDGGGSVRDARGTPSTVITYSPPISFDDALIVSAVFLRLFLDPSRSHLLREKKEGQRLHVGNNVGPSR